MSLMLMLFSIVSVNAQDIEEGVKLGDKDSLNREKDITDVLRRWFKVKEKKADTSSKRTALLPAIGYNPSIGFLLGVNFVRSNYRGPKKLTKMSVASLDFSVTSKKLLIARFRHNTFTNNNEWNLQGNYQLIKSFIMDYGLGSAAVQTPPVSYSMRYDYFKFSERAYRKITEHFFAGMGISIDMRNSISQDNADSGSTNPNEQYSLANGFNPEKYNVNGLIVNFQYNTRENPNRSFGGMYIDLYYRNNTTWLGSTKSSSQLYTELRKYWSLSKKNPENVIAIWYWGSFLVSGNQPYLDLQNTANDTYNRSGRGYTFGRFRGQNYAYFETEYRFPISQTTKLFSGVVFTNFQTASEKGGPKLFHYVVPAVGAGIRLLFSKGSRTNICLDYAHGMFGSSGFFFALNEAF